MDKVINFAIILMFLVGMTMVIITAVPAQEEPIMGVWITSINGIPVEQNGQYGQFRIFEVESPGGT